MGTPALKETALVCPYLKWKKLKEKNAKVPHQNKKS